jgi:alpha-L-rhamnosidase
MKLKIFISVILLLSSWQCNYFSTPPFKFEKILCNYIDNPIALDSKNPRFSWIISGTLPGQNQKAYQIQVASDARLLEDGKCDLWDSGPIESNINAHHLYQGLPLKSNQKYFWSVRVWDNYQNMVKSKIATFHTALLDPVEWQAKWIGAGPEKEYLPESGFFMSPNDQYELADTIQHEGRSLLLRNTFHIDKKIESARLYITGLGYYEAFINGKRIGDHVLSPAKTQYRHQILYDTYDVTNLLYEGKNSIGIHLGNGWFNPYKKWWREYRMQWFGAKRTIAQLEVQYEDASRTTFITDENWNQANGPLLFNCIYDGEIYDAREEYAGWTNKDFDDSPWPAVSIMEKPGGRMISQQMPAIKVVDTINPQGMTEPRPGIRVYDMGQNFAGWVRITMKGKKGTRIRLRFAEDEYEDGSLDVTSNEHAKAQAVYIMKGGGSEVYEPRFTFFGFKYVEISADPELPEIENIKGCVVHSANPIAGILETDNDLINKIHHATVWSQKSNMIGYPLDCPQRDERLGWFGDAQVTAEEAMFNFDMVLFYQNWLSGIRLNQHPESGDLPIISPRPYILDEGVEWSSTFFTITWDYYRYYGDKQILSENYDSMKQYLKFLDNISKDFIVPMGWIGDWGSLVEGWHEGEPASIPTAFYYYNSKILSKIAAILGKHDDQREYAELATSIRQAYNRKYFDHKSKNYTDGSQMANAFPIYLGLVEEKYKNAVLKNLIDDIVKKQKGHLTTGVLGSKYMIDALTMEDHADIAWILATARGYPSWSDMVEKYTTMCEFWTLKQSHNHVFTGSIDAWFYKALAGIRLDDDKPAFKNIIIKPYIPESLNYVKARIETIAGTVSSEWIKDNKRLTLNISIPFNSTARIYLPMSSNSQILLNDRLISESGNVKYLGVDNSYQVYAVVSGKYRFSGTLN